MKIFIDSADLDEIRQFYSWGIADGVTTNPTLMRKAVEKSLRMGEKLDMKSYVEKILRVGAGTPVSLEVTETSGKAIVEQGKKLYGMFNPIANNVCIKIPINTSATDGDKNHFDGLYAIKALAQEGIPVNSTLVFTPEQALLAAKAGAKFVSPFAGRVDDDLREKNSIKYDKGDYYPMEGFEKEGKLLEDNGIVFRHRLGGEMCGYPRNVGP